MKQEQYGVIQFFVLVGKENKCGDNSEEDTNDNSTDKFDTRECLLI